MLVTLPAAAPPAGDDAPPPTVERLDRIEPVVQQVRAGTLALVGIDMPIGLPDTWGRACDAAARARLGPRRASLFPTPPRFLLDHTDDHRTADAESRRRTGRGLSIQAFHLLPKMAELDAAVDVEDTTRLFECHPESCFVTLAGRPLTTAKRSAAGRAERARLLAPQVTGLDRLLAARPRGVATDDLLDAVAVAWTARRHLAGEATVLGDGARDGHGLPMRLVV